MQDVRVIVYEGKHHPVDSKEVAFVAAGKRAFLDAIAKARPPVQEPIVDLDVKATEQNMGNTRVGLASQRARDIGPGRCARGELVDEAEVPAAGLTGPEG